MVSSAPITTDYRLSVDDTEQGGVDNLLLTTTTHGRDTSTNNNIGTTPPRQIGITLRLDF